MVRLSGLLCVVLILVVIAAAIVIPIVIVNNKKKNASPYGQYGQPQGPPPGYPPAPGTGQYPYGQPPSQQGYGSQDPQQQPGYPPQQPPYPPQQQPPYGG